MRPSPSLRLAVLVLTLGTCVALASARAAAPQRTPTEPPKVRLIATGGTISKKAAGRLTVDELINSVPTLGRFVRAESEQFANTSSSSLTLGNWRDLARRINTLFRQDGELSGIVVTIGTDTLEETAYFLNLTVKSEKPVVVVGAMRDSAAVGYDGAANLLAGFRVAADPASRGRGVLVVLNDQINAARDVTKSDANRLDTFESRSYGILGVVDRDRVVYYRSVVKRHTASTEFDVFSIDQFPRVDVALVYQDAAGDVIKAMVDLGARGIVVAAAGAGAVSGSQDDGIRYAISRGVFVVVSTRTGSGRILTGGVEPDADSGSRSALRLAAEDLSPLKARILLMLALATTKDADTIRRMFAEY